MSKPTVYRVPLFVLAAAALAFCFLPATATALQLFSDGFNYPNGNLVGQGGWYAHSAGGNKPIQVLAGAITAVQSAGSGEDDNHPFAQQLGTAKTYCSFTLKVPPGSVIGTAQDYFIHFRPAGTDSNNFVARTWIGPQTSGGDYDLGIAAGSLTTTPVVKWPTSLTFGVTYHVVIAYDGTTGTSTLWLDPANEASSSISSTMASLNNRLLASIAVRQASPSGATDSQVIDDIGVGTTFDDAQTPHQSLPGLSPWGMMVLAALLIGTAAMVGVRRRTVIA